MMESTVSDRSARWRGLLARQISSGLSVAAFCRREGVALSTFHWWSRKLAPAGDCGSPGAVDWVEAQPMTPPSFPGGAAVRLGNGVTEIDNNRCEQSIRPIALGRKMAFGHAAWRLRRDRQAAPRQGVGFTWAVRGLRRRWQRS